MSECPVARADLFCQDLGTFVLKKENQFCDYITTDNDITGILAN